MSPPAVTALDVTPLDEAPLDVVGLGEAMLRLSTPAGVRLDAADALAATVGGAELNVLVALAALGLRTGWLSALPGSPLGRRVARDAAAAGVDTSAVAWVPDARLGLYFVETGAGVRPSEVLYDRRGSAFAAYAPSAIDLRGAAYAVLSGLTLALGPAAARTASAYATTARQGSRLVLDVNHRSRLWSAAAAATALRPVLAAADVVVCSRDDARLVLGCAGPPEDALVAVRERWAPAATVVVLTCGADGAVGIDAADDVLVQPAVPSVELDGFGAGDAFLAGLLWGLIGGRGLAFTLHAAVVLGALACTVHGDQARFSATELTRAMAGTAGVLR